MLVNEEFKAHNTQQSLHAQSIKHLNGARVSLSNEISSSEGVPQTCFSTIVIIVLFLVAIFYTVFTAYLVVLYPGAFSSSSNIFGYVICIVGGSPAFVLIGIFYGLEAKPPKIVVRIVISFGVFVIPLCCVLALVAAYIAGASESVTSALWCIMVGAPFTVLIWLPLHSLIKKASRGLISSSLVSTLALTMCIFMIVPFTFLPIYITLKDDAYLGYNHYYGEGVMIISICLYITWTTWAFYHGQYFVPRRLDERINPILYYIASVAIVTILSVTTVVLVSISFSAYFSSRDDVYGFSRNAFLRFVAFMQTIFTLTCIPFGQSRIDIKEKYVVGGSVSMIMMISLFFVYTKIADAANPDAVFEEFFIYMTFAAPVSVLTWTVMAVHLNRTDTNPNQNTENLPYILVANRRLTYPVSSALLCACCLFPIGVLIPVVILFGSKMQTGVLSVILAICGIPALLTIVFIVRYVWQKALAVFVQLQNEFNDSGNDNTIRERISFLGRKIPVAVVGAWLTSTAAVIGMLCIFGIMVGLKIENNMHLTLLGISFMAPCIIWYGIRMIHADLAARKYQFTSVLLVLLPCVISVPLWEMDVSNEAELQNLFAGIGFGIPASGIMLMLLWKVSDFFTDPNVFAIMGTMCCCCMLVPLVMIAPAVYCSSAGVSLTVGNYFGLFVVLCMTTTCLNSISLNARLQKINQEKDDKVTISRLLLSAKASDLIIPQEKAIYILIAFKKYNNSMQQRMGNKSSFSKYMYDSYNILPAKHKGTVQLVSLKMKEQYDRLKLEKEAKEREKQEAEEQARQLEIDMKESKNAVLREEKRKKYLEMMEQIRKKQEKEEELHIQKEELRLEAEKIALSSQEIKLRQILHDITDLEQIVDVNELGLDFLEELYPDESEKSMITIIRKLCFFLFRVSVNQPTLSVAEEKFVTIIEHIDEEVKLSCDRNKQDEFPNANPPKPPVLPMNAFSTIPSVGFLDELDDEFYEEKDGTDLRFCPTPESVKLVGLDDFELSKDDIPEVTFLGKRNDSEEDILNVSLNPDENFHDLIEDISGVTHKLNINLTKRIEARRLAAERMEKQKIESENIRKIKQNDNNTEKEVVLDIDNMETDSVSSEVSELIADPNSHLDDTNENEESINKDSRISVLSKEHSNSVLKKNEIEIVSIYDEKNGINYDGEKVIGEVIEEINDTVKEEENENKTDDENKTDHIVHFSTKKSKTIDNICNRLLLAKYLEIEYEEWLARQQREKLQLQNEQKMDENEKSKKWHFISACFPHRNDQTYDEISVIENDWMDFSEEDDDVVLNRAGEDVKEETSLMIIQPETISWLDCVNLIEDTLLTSMHKDMAEYEKLKDIVLSFSVSNILAIFDILIEFYSLNAIPFSINDCWQLSETEEAVAGAALFNFPESWDTWAMTFWLCILLGIIYPIFALFGVKAAKTNHLGHDKDGNIASTCSWSFIYSKLLLLLGSSMYFTIMINLVEAFVCDYKLLDTGYMVFQHDVQCWTSSHVLYALPAFLVGICYYPMASFMYPNMQFVDDTLDIKYTPSFLIFSAQGKLYLIGLMSFFSKSSYLILSSAFIIFSILSVTNEISSPCLVKRVNLWKTGSYAMCAWTCVACIVGLTTNNSRFFGFVTLYSGWFVLAVWTGYRYYHTFGTLGLEFLVRDEGKHAEKSNITYDNSLHKE